MKQCPCVAMCVHLFLIFPYKTFNLTLVSTPPTVIMTLFVAASLAICSVNQNLISSGIPPVAQIVLCILLLIEET